MVPWFSLAYSLNFPQWLFIVPLQVQCSFYGEMHWRFLFWFQSYKDANQGPNLENIPTRTRYLSCQSGEKETDLKENVPPLWGKDTVDNIYNEPPQSTLITENVSNNDEEGMAFECLSRSPSPKRIKLKSRWIQSAGSIDMPSGPWYLCNNEPSIRILHLF